MIILKKITTVFAPILILLSFESVVVFPARISIAAFFSFFVLFMTCYFLVRKIRSAKFFGFLSPALLLITGTYGMIMILEGFIWIQAVIILTVLIYSLYLRQIFMFLFQQPLYQPYSLENISLYMTIVTSFFMLVMAFSSHLFLSMRTYQVSVPIVGVILILVLQTFWIHKIRILKSKKTIASILFIILEAYWAIHFLPTNHYMNALLLTVIFYVILNFSKMYLTNMMTIRSVKRQLTLCVIIFIISMSSARWL